MLPHPDGPTWFVGNDDVFHLIKRNLTQNIHQLGKDVVDFTVEFLLDHRFVSTDNGRHPALQNRRHLFSHHGIIFVKQGSPFNVATHHVLDAGRCQGPRTDLTGVGPRKFTVGILGNHAEVDPLGLLHHRVQGQKVRRNPAS